MILVGDGRHLGLSRIVFPSGTTSPRGTDNCVVQVVRKSVETVVYETNKSFKSADGIVGGAGKSLGAAE